MGATTVGGPLSEMALKGLVDWGPNQRIPFISGVIRYVPQIQNNINLQLQVPCWILIIYDGRHDFLSMKNPLLRALVP